MPKRGTYVITASVYVDDVFTPEEATNVIELLNSMVGQKGPNSLISVEVRLPDPGIGREWERVAD